MVLNNNYKRKFIFLIIAILFSVNIYAQPDISSTGNNYWIEFMHTAFEKSKKVNEIKKEYIFSIINKNQYNYKWLPTLYFELQNTFKYTRGDSISILNQNSGLEQIWLSNSITNIVINQKLPGNGYLSLNSSYGLNYSISNRVFLQSPQIQFSLNQYLSRGAFGITKDPEFFLIKEQTKYAELIYKQNLNYEIQKILQIIKKFDCFCSQENYYNSLVQEYESELNTSIEKNNSGLQSNLQIHYSRHQYLQALNNLNNIRSEKENIRKELLLLVPYFNISNLNEERYALYKMIHQIYTSLEIENESIEKNIESKIYSSILKQHLLQYQTEEMNFAPEFFMISSLSPNNNINNTYGDWYKSFRILKENKNFFDYSIIIGIRKNFDIPLAKKTRKEIYKLKKNSIEIELSILQSSQKKELEILKENVNTKHEYIENLNVEIKSEQSFREKRQNLYKNNIISKDEFLKSETFYYQIYMDYINTFWECVDNHISIINMCSSEALILKNFCGDLL